MKAFDVGGLPVLRRRTLLAAVGSGALAAAAGCARGTQTRAAPAGVVTLNNDNATWAPGYAAASGPLHARTGYRLSPRAVPNVSAYQQIVRMSAQTDSTTDLIKWWNGYRLQDIARGEILTDLTEPWDKAQAAGLVDPTLRESFSYQGKPYAMPLYKSYYAIFYSKKAFAKVGVQPPRSWADFMRVAATFQKAGVTPIASSGASDWESIIWFAQLLIGMDPNFYQKLTSGKARYTDPTAVQAMTLWSQMYSQKLFSAPDYDGQGTPGHFKDGSIAMTLGGTWNTNAYTTAGLTDADFGIFLLPSVRPSAPAAVVVESGALAVPINAHKKNAALDVATAWLAGDVQRAWVGFLKDTSANPQVVPDVPAIRALHLDLKARKPREMTRYWEASPPALVEGNVNELSAFMVNPSSGNIRPTLQRMQKRANTEWKTWSS